MKRLLTNPFLISIVCIVSAFFAWADPSISLTLQTPSVICSTGNDTVRYSVSATGIPANTNVVIYQSTDSLFNPYNGQGDSIAFIPGNAIPRDTMNFGSCVKTLGIFIDACGASGQEGRNEYMILTSGTGIKVSNLSINYDPANSNSGNNNDNDINTGTNPCGFKTPNATLISNLQIGSCNASNIIPASPTDSIPPNAIILCFTSDNVTANYSVNGLCNLGYPIYVIQSSCTRTIGAFTNAASCSSTATTRYRRTLAIDKRQNCQDNFVYDRCGLFDLDGTYAIRQQGTDTASVANNGIRRNQIDSCGGIDYAQLNFSSDTVLKIALSRNDCNSGKHFIKAITRPNGSQPISNTIAYQLVCNDVNATTSTTDICNGDSAIINISSSDPNASLSWTVSGGAAISGASAGTGNSIRQLLSYSGNTKDSVIYTVSSNDAGCVKTQEVKVVVKNCASTSFIGNVINTYTPVLSIDTNCTHVLHVQDASTFNVGDTVLIIQMKGAIMDTSNTAQFGNIIDYNSAGNYEFNSIKNKNGNVLELNYLLSRSYDIPAGKVQLVRVPYFENVNITSTLTCLPWDGSKGGVLVFNVINELNMAADIDVSSKGFLGGNGVHSNYFSLNCNQTDFYYEDNQRDFANEKGESIADVSSVKKLGRGKSISGGGGGNSHNSGGGGGGNGGIGGYGGYQLEDVQFGGCGGGPSNDNRGLGGISLSYSNANNRIFLGGGAGAGQANNPELFAPKGGNGGGIVIFSAQSVIANNHNILSKGEDGANCGSTGSGCHEGMGGGGAGGTVLSSINSITGNLTVDVSGGKGANMSALESQFSRVGPGGGGGGGIYWTSLNSIPSNVQVITQPGASGRSISFSNTTWGATDGQAGAILPDLNLPVSSMLPGISVSISGNTQLCNGNSITLTVAGQYDSIRWSNGATTSQIVVSTPGSYSVTAYKNGCNNSDVKRITACQQQICNPLITGNKVFCQGDSIVLDAGSGFISYLWNTGATTQTIKVKTNGKYVVSVTGLDNCTGKDSVEVVVNPTPVVTISGNTSLCPQSQTILTANTTADSLRWNTGDTTASITVVQAQSYSVTVFKNGCTNSAAVQVTQLSVPAAFTLGNDTTFCGDFTKVLSTGVPTTQWSTNQTGSQITVSTAGSFIATISNACGSVSDTIEITKNTLPAIQLGNDTTICSDVLPLSVSGQFRSISWSTGEETPSITVTKEGLYFVKVTDQNGCSGSDTIEVTSDCVIDLFIPNAFTPNGDGVNDVFLVRGNAQTTNIEQMIIYNRWGNKVFEAKNILPNDLSAGWDGKYKGALAQEDAYGYYVVAKFKDGTQKILKGNVTLLR